MFTHLDQWEPAYIPVPYEKRTTGTAQLQDGTPEVPGNQHLQDGMEKDFEGNYFKCDCKGHLSYKCTKTTKADGSPANSNDVAK